MSPNRLFSSDFDVDICLSSKHLDFGVFAKDEQVFAARTHPRPVTFMPWDSKCFTKHPTRSGWYISSPNMEIIPQFPMKDHKIRYFEDGMMGPLEFFKWPQEYDPKCPFAYAAPGNPDLMEFPHQTFPTVDIHNILPSFADDKVTWFHSIGEKFEVTDVFPTGDYGRLHEDVLKRLKDSLLEAVSMVKKAGKELGEKFEKMAENRPYRKEVEDSYVLCLSLQPRLQQSYQRLFNGDLTPAETMLYFREFQRLLLAIRGWLIFTTVIWPRLLREGETFHGHPLPLRGVFTEDNAFAHKMLRVGVPVWLVRPASSFSGSYIQKCTTFVPARRTFSNLNMMRFGRFNVNTPAWVRDSDDDDPTLTSLMDRLDKLSVSNHALVAVAQHYDPSVATMIFRQAVEHAYDFDAAAPALTWNSLPEERFRNIENVTEAINTMNTVAATENSAWEGKLNCVQVYFFGLMICSPRASRR